MLYYITLYSNGSQSQMISCITSLLGKSIRKNQY